jgi:energy-converting hydrogenase Eha subunit F
MELSGYFHRPYSRLVLPSEKSPQNVKSQHPYYDVHRSLIWPPSRATTTAAAATTTTNTTTTAATITTTTTTTTRTVTTK